MYVPGAAYQNPVGNGTCQVLLQTLTTVSQIILGDVFFRQYTISFDRIDTQVGFYGKITQINKFDPSYFNIIQYIMCGLCLILGFTGIALWLIDRSKMESMVERKLGVELLPY